VAALQEAQYKLQDNRFNTGKMLADSRASTLHVNGAPSTGN
jgi:hypothetical protein